ncbi:hypothetical protein [Nonomuraea dietziae]|uniref:hypothetical protein n=1 Tax=Nonomuraea dietziae TaxID=65515 RepID=UPI0031E2FA4E
MYDYYWAAEDNFVEVDRHAAKGPDIIRRSGEMLRNSRAFLPRGAVRHLSSRASTSSSTSARSRCDRRPCSRGDRRARIVYVDNDPVVLTPLQALLGHSPASTSRGRPARAGERSWRSAAECSTSSGRRVSLVVSLMHFVHATRRIRPASSAVNRDLLPIPAVPVLTHVATPTRCRRSRQGQLRLPERLLAVHVPPAAATCSRASGGLRASRARIVNTRASGVPDATTDRSLVKGDYHLCAVGAKRP